MKLIFIFLPRFFFRFPISFLIFIWSGHFDEKSFSKVLPPLLSSIDSRWLCQDEADKLLLNFTMRDYRLSKFLDTIDDRNILASMCTFIYPCLRKKIIFELNKLLSHNVKGIETGLAFIAQKKHFLRFSTISILKPVIT